MTEDLGTRPEGVLHFYADLSVDLDEMRHWPPHIIEAFFEGIARAATARAYGRNHLATLGSAHAAGVPESPNAV